MPVLSSTPARPHLSWLWAVQRDGNGCGWACDSYSLLVSYLEPGIQNLEWPPWLSRVQVEVGMAREVIHNLTAAWFSNLRSDYGYESAWLGVWPRVDTESPVSCYLPPLHSAPATCHVPDVSCTATPSWLPYLLYTVPHVKASLNASQSKNEKASWKLISALIELNLYNRKHGISRINHDI